ncbi:MAG TPA: DUF1570 domain-containing protein [Pirellulaceae bacterium]
MPRNLPRRPAIAQLAGSCLAALGVVVAPTLARGDWPHERRQSPFAIHADFPLARLDPLLNELLQLQQELRSRLNLVPSREGIDVYLFSESDVYHAYMQRHFPEITPRRAMFIKSNSPGNVFAFVSPELATDLRHECTHAVLHAALPVVPLWLDEGLAEYFEVPAIQRTFDHPHMSATRRGLLWSRPPSLERLEALTELDQMGTREYQEAWAWTHFLLHGPPTARQALASYFRDIAQATPPQPISRRLQEAMPRPDREFVGHFQRWRR